MPKFPFFFLLFLSLSSFPSKVYQKARQSDDLMKTVGVESFRSGNIETEIYDDYPFERFSSRRVYYAFDFLPGSSDIIYSANTSGQFNLWRQSPPPSHRSSSSSSPTKRSTEELELGAEIQLTGFDEWSVRFIQPLPDGKSTLLFADRDGDENYQIFIANNEVGWQRPLVMKKGVRNNFGIECISPDGRLAAYSSNERSKKDLDVIVTNIKTRETRVILEGDGSYVFGNWSPSGMLATVLEPLGTDDNNILLVNMSKSSNKNRTSEKNNQNKINLTPHTDRAGYLPCSWDSENGFYLLSNEGKEFQGLAYISLENGGSALKLKWIETPKFDIQDASLSPSGRILAWVSNQEGYSFIHFHEANRGGQINSKPLCTPINTGGVLLPGWFENAKLIKFSEDGRRIIFHLSTPSRPAEIYVMNLESVIPERAITASNVRRRRGGKESKLLITRFTHGFIGAVPQRLMAKPKLVHYKSFDERKIPAFLYKPRFVAVAGKGKGGQGRVPAVVFVHGGPESQERPWYSYAGLYQYLLSRGVAVMALNIRGSTGYGKSYQRLIHHDWGGGELKDIEYAAKFLQSLDWIDSKRIGIMGGSFGGFATLSAVTRLPEYWRVAVDIFGPSNLVTFGRSIPEHWKRFLKDWAGDPETEADFLLMRSPITYIDNVRCPLLIIQGANDPRVVKAESDQIVEKLRSMGREVEYIVFPDEGHGFTKRKNEFTAYKKSSDFLLRYLLERNEGEVEDSRVVMVQSAP
jgi:dienelactone hydrolase/Tol biopolymer transport system component